MKKIFIYARACVNKDFVHSGSIDPLTDTAAILNLLHLTSIMGCPGGTREVFRPRFSGKKRTSLYISREKGDHYYIQTRHNDLFSHYNLFLGKRKEKLARKARVYILSEYIGSCS